jgi:hypothetical protein
MEGLRRGFHVVPKVTVRGFALPSEIWELMQLGRNLSLPADGERHLVIDGTSYGVQWNEELPIEWSHLGSGETRGLALWASQIIDLLKSAVDDSG